MVLESAVICLALNIYYEARSEHTMGQIAVANVTLNRAGHDYTKVCDVVFKPNQFSWTITKVERRNGRHSLKSGHGPRNTFAIEHALAIARAAIAGRLPDFTKGATHYHADYVTPGWSRKFTKVAHIGRHLFYRAS